LAREMQFYSYKKDANSYDQERRRTLLKISIQEHENLSILKIEGKLIKPWVLELDRAWSMISLGSRNLCLDICGMTFIDEEGKRILRDIFRATGAEILADSPLTKQFANEVSQVLENDGTEK
jgi:hypothetical protein